MSDFLSILQPVQNLQSFSWAWHDQQVNGLQCSWGQWGAKGWSWTAWTVLSPYRGLWSEAAGSRIPELCRGVRGFMSVLPSLSNTLSSITFFSFLSSFYIFVQKSKMFPKMPLWYWNANWWLALKRRRVLPCALTEVCGFLVRVFTVSHCQGCKCLSFVQVKSLE